MHKIDEIIEENFCLKLELDILAEVLLRNQSERWVPGFLHQSTEHAHVERYKLACEYSHEKRVIDIACGVGKGSFILAEEGGAQCVDAYDIQEEAIRYAKWRNKNEKISFGTGDAEKISFTEKFDLAVSFETIEHLNNHNKFIQNIHRALSNNGTFIVSTPISSVDLNSTPSNPYHVQEWGFKAFHKILQPYFDIEEVYVQLYPYHLAKVNPKITIMNLIIGKIKRYASKSKSVSENEVRLKNQLSPFPEIEKYCGQYEVSELGSTRTGYQIVIARKKIL